MIDKELLKGSTAILVLRVIQAREMYGYEIAREVGRRSGGVFNLKEGTLYPILHSLEAEGALESFWTRREGERRRKYYRLTPVGEGKLEARLGQWQTFRDAVERVLAGEVS